MDKKQQLAELKRQLDELRSLPDRPVLIGDIIRPMLENPKIMELHFEYCRLWEEIHAEESELNNDGKI